MARLSVDHVSGCGQTRLVLDLSRSSDGHFQGTIASESATEATPFWGTLELLRLLEELVTTEPPPNTTHDP